MEVIKYFPLPLRKELEAVDMDGACDIRLFAGRPCIVHLAEGEYISEYIPDAGELYDTAQALSRRMLHLSDGSTAEGYITLHGGHRMGLCGHVTCEQEGLMLHGIGSICLRLARECVGCGETAAKAVLSARGGVLLAGAPGVGKTTMLRDAVRRLSDTGWTVGLADERGEVAACLDGVPQLDVGMRTHVVDGCKKGDALRWLLRAMSPRLLATDELYGIDECMAVREAAACGVPVLSTVHAGSAAELCARRGVRFLLEEGTIDKVLFLQNRKILLAANAREVLETACLQRL